MRLYAAKEENLIIRARDPRARDLEEHAKRAYDRGEMLKALTLFEQVHTIDSAPLTRSCLAWCLACERGEFETAVKLAVRALREEPGEPLHYLNFGRVQMLAGRRRDAVRMLRKGQALAKSGRDRVFREELQLLGVRGKPPLRFLSRGNPLNKYLGKMLCRLGWR